MPHRPASAASRAPDRPGRRLSLLVDQTLAPTPALLPRKPARAIAVLSAITLALSFVGGGYALTRAQPAPPTLAHIWVIVMENRDYGQVIGSANAPYINELANQYGLATQYYGITHGSQPNYIGLFSGAEYGVTGGSKPTLSEPNLADQIEAGHRTWHVYAENFPGNCFNGVTASAGPDGPGVYVRRHVPAMAFRDIRTSPARCANVTDFEHFDPAAANFELIVPNLTNNGHDGTTQQADAFLRRFVPRITASPAWQQGGALFVIWDEGREKGPNRVAALVISPQVTPGFRSSVRHDHYSLLHTIETAWGLPCLANACRANTLTEFFGTSSAT
jgi:hypothetical protein